MGWSRVAARYAGPPALGALMVAVAGVTGNRAVLFPEAVALAFGIWTLRRTAWSRPVPLVAVPTACALLGLACAHAPGPAWVWTSVALTGATAFLHAVQSPLIPGLSAAVLPVVFGVREILYPAAVAGWCLVLVAGAALVRFPPPVDGPAPAAAPGTPRWPIDAVVRFVVAAVAWAVAAGLAGLPATVVAPPLLVAGLEFAVRRGRPLSAAAFRRVLLMAAAGVVGALAVGVGGPAWFAAGVAVALVVAAATAVREPLTPATALALVPFVAGTGDPWLVGGSFLAGAVVLTVLPALLGRPRAG